MADFEQCVALDLNKHDANRHTVYVGMGDHGGTMLVATVYDNGVPVSLVGADVAAVALLNDGSVITIPCAVSGSTASCDLDASVIGGKVVLAYLTVACGEQVCSSEAFDIITLEGDAR